MWNSEQPFVCAPHTPMPPSKQERGEERKGARESNVSHSRASEYD